MSDALAIAAVTGLLRDLLNGVMTDPDLNLSTVVGSTVGVSALPPDLIKSDTNGTNQLNLFLYQVQPNQGWRNVNNPSLDARGDRIANPPLRPRSVLFAHGVPRSGHARGSDKRLCDAIPARIRRAHPRDDSQSIQHMEWQQ